MADQRLTRLKERASLLPLEPGVYQFVNSEGKVIYVGKAKSLRKRVTSYFSENKDQSPKIKVMVRHIEDIRHYVVESESDALFLENNLIKSLQPRYNVLLKDDKTYPWIVIRNEHFPRVQSTRKFVRDGSKYYGPYASVVSQKNVLDLVHSIYQLRTCPLNLDPVEISKGKYSVCLQYHIGNCRGPCVGKQSEEDYERNMEMIRKTLAGDLRSTRIYLQNLMESASGARDYEAAFGYKIRLEMLDNYESKSVIVNNTGLTADIISVIKDIDTAYCNYMRISRGGIVNTFTVQLSLGVVSDDRSILTQVIEQITQRLSGQLAKEVIVPFLPEVEAFPGVKFTVPQRGDKQKLLEFSTRNAKMYRLDKMKNLEFKDPAKHSERILEAMRRELRLKELPRHIECFDNSNLQGSYPVASCVVFRDAKPSKKEYRHFNVKTVEGPDDFASMREIVYRRYKRILDENGDLPDLIIVDGGKGQLSSAYSVLRELDLADKVPIVGLAKRIEEVFYPNDPMPYYLDRTGEPLKVIMHIRDEAHRFGITFHRQKRSIDFIKSELEMIPGLGEKSITKLLKKFKTISGIKKAPFEELKECVGSNRASLIIDYFKE